MIEDIKKEITEKINHMYVQGDYISETDYLMLEKKVEDLEKYKNAWEDMRKWFSQRNSKYDTPKSLEIENFVSTFMQELEQKNGIGDDKE